MEKVWLKNYPAGVPEEIDMNEFSSLVDLFESSATRWQRHTAYIHMDRTISYGQLLEASGHFASFLQNHLHLTKGDRVMLMMPNVMQYPVALFGALRAGCVVVNCNPLYTPRELAYQLNDSGAQTIVILENFAHTLEQVLPDTNVKNVLVTSLGDMLGGLKGRLVNALVRYGKRMVAPWQISQHIRWHEALTLGQKHAFIPVPLNHEDLAFLQYTGGTTGVVKGAMLTHGNMVANLQQASSWISASLQEGCEVVITALPLYHIFSLTANCLTFIKLGAANVLITNPKDIHGFVKELSKHRFTAITGVNTLFNALLNEPNFEKLDFSHLRCTLGGGMAVQRAVAERWQAVTGKTLTQAYGLTETSPAVCINPLTLNTFNGSIGLPVASTEVAIRDELGRDVPFGVCGELCVRGPQVMKGYYNRPEETAKVIMTDGFLRTGDIATMDEEGFVYIVDRKKDMIEVSGFKVYPNEIEEVIAAMDGVLEAAAIGIDDEKTGEAVKLYVVRKDPSLTREAILAYCKANLTAYKVPHHIAFRDELPKSNVGKVLRRALRDENK